MSIPQAITKRSGAGRSSRSPPCSEELIRGIIKRARGSDAAALYRKKTTKGALTPRLTPTHSRRACWQVMATVNESLPDVNYEPSSVTLDFLKRVAQLSWHGDGPRLAKELLEGNGIPLVILPHLPRTYLDGAALQLGDGRPVIGLTLRYDRIDNFWFFLLHELAHVGRHLEHGESDAFFDDLNLRKEAADDDQNLEIQTDEWAEKVLIPSEIWEKNDVRTSYRFTLQSSLDGSGMNKMNYRLLSQVVGSGQIRR